MNFSAEIFFSSEVTAESARSEFPHLAKRRLHIIPQGQCHSPTKGTKGPADCVSALVRPSEDAGDFVVLGCGTVHIRKGVDILLACAATIKRCRRVKSGPCWINGLGVR